MSVETVLFLVTAVGIAAYRLALWVMQKHGENAEAAFWSNVRHPLIYEMPDATDISRQETVLQYERALEMLEKHGNKWLGRTRKEREKNVFIWIWAADEQNTVVDFEGWQRINIARRQQTFEAFYALKAANAIKAGKPQEAAIPDRQTIEFTDV